MKNLFLTKQSPSTDLSRTSWIDLRNKSKSYLEIQILHKHRGGKPQDVNIKTPAR